MTKKPVTAKSPYLALRILIPTGIAALIFALAISTYPTPPILRDALGYTRTAQRLVADGVYSYGTELPGTKVEPDAFVPPGYVMMLAGFYAASGQDGQDAESWTRSAHPLILGFQFLLALGTVTCLALCGRALGGDRMGIVTGVLAALYVSYGWASSLALSELLGALTVSALLLTSIHVTHAEKKPSMRQFAVLGALTAAVALVRPAYSAWVLVPVAMAAWRHRRDPAPVGKAVVTWAVAAILVMAPWWVRNAVVLDDIVLLSAGGAAPMLDATGGRSFTAEEAVVANQAEADGRDPDAAVAWSRLRLEWNSSPAEFVQVRVMNAWRVLMRSWSPIRDVYWEERFDPGHPRVYLQDFPVEPTPSWMALDAWLSMYHRLLLGLALGSLVFVRRSPRLLVALSLPVYAIAAHFTTLFIDRYFFPAMAGVIVSAGALVYATVSMATRKAGSVPHTKE